MCRWIAYRGRTIALEHYVTEPAHSLISQSIHALESTASTNGDGFGLGWYGEHAEPGLYRELRPAWADENLRYLCRHLRSHLFFAHARAATGTAIMRPNCHPFACGKWLFMHNGFVGGWTKLRRKVEALIPDTLYPSRNGTTDSEAVFLAILGAGLLGAKARDATGETDPVQAAESAVTAIVALSADDPQPLRVTAALSDGRDLYAFRYSSHDEANSLYFQESGESVVIVSEPLDHDHRNWTSVPDGSVVVARAGEPVRMAPFLRRSSEARA